MILERDFRGLEISNIAPDPNRKKYWADLHEDATGQTIKIWDGKEWKSMSGGNLNDSSVWPIPSNQTILADSIISSNSITGELEFYTRRVISDGETIKENTTIIPIATTNENGLMSYQDKQQVNIIASALSDIVAEITALWVKVDISASKMSAPELFDIIIRMDIPYDQVILYPTFVHVSHKSSGDQRKQWFYSKGMI